MGIAMTTSGDEIPARFAKLAKAELRAFAHVLGRMRKPGKRDRAVHQARKALQRLRALLRLAHDVAPALVAPVERSNRSLRRRFSRLRDCATRIELVEDLMRQDAAVAGNEHSRAALAHLIEARDLAWAKLPADFLARIEHRFAVEQKRFSRLPLAELTDEHLRTALSRERRRVLRRLRRALGDTRRLVRHELRRHLRRYAAMRTAAATIRRRRDAGAGRLAEAARSIGVEGDVWLTRTALLEGDHSADVRALARSLESRRKALCKLHDGELAALRRQVLRKRGTPARSGH